jgi:hypothetical protein
MNPLKNLARRRLFVVALVVSSMALASVGVAEAAPTSRAGTHVTPPSGLSIAKKQLAPYNGRFPAFPITQRLKKKPAASDDIVYLACGASQCATFGTLLGEAAKALGVKFTTINAGLFPSQAQAAAGAALALKPSAVIVAGLALSSYGHTLKPIEKLHIPIIGIGTDDGEKYGLTADLGNQVTVALAGALMADWVAINQGATANVAFFGTPELDFSPVMWSGFSSQMKKVCKSCQVALTQMTVLDFGTSAASALVVAYLRAHPSVNTVVFAAAPGSDGLAPALAEAGLSSVTVFGWNPDNTGLASIKAGQIAGGIGLDTLTSCWQAIDIIAKLLTHQSFPASETNAVLEVLNKNDVTSQDVSSVEGWSAYHNAQALTEALWP